MARTSVVLPAPSSPDTAMTAGRRSARANASPHATSPGSSTSALATPRPVRLFSAPVPCPGAPSRLEVHHLVANLGRQLEVEVGGGGVHRLVELRQDLLALRHAGVGPRCTGLGNH